MAVIVDTLTDNKNRTAANVRSAFTKGNGNIGTQGSVSFMFDKKGQIVIDKEECEMDPDELMMLALDAGAEDLDMYKRQVDDLEQFIKDNDVQMAALTIPKTKAPEIAERLVKAGIKAIWNFAHVDWNVPEDVVVENVHLSESLMRLSYRVCSLEDRKEKQREKERERAALKAGKSLKDEANQ